MLKVKAALYDFTIAILGGKTPAGPSGMSNPDHHSHSNYAIRCLG